MEGVTQGDAIRRGHQFARARLHKCTVAGRAGAVSASANDAHV
jgi:hypothetical protein